MLPSSNESAHAVMFLNNGEIVGEMLYSEFEAVLDSFIPLCTFASQTMHGVYLDINYRLHVTAAVFFLIDFDHQGYADKKWNLPLGQLNETAAKGPDLGSGPIRLACYTQCPIRWHQRSLWDPNMSPDANDFTTIQRAITTNKLGIRFKQDVTAPTLNNITIPTLTSVEERNVERHWTEDFESEITAKLYRSFRNRLANTLKKQRLRLATLRNKNKKRIEDLSRAHQARVQRFHEEIEDRERALEKQAQITNELKATIDSQSEKMSKLREYFEERLKSAKYTSEEQIQLLNQQFEAETQARIESVTTELKEKVQLREIEIMYLTEHQNNMLEEVQTLRNDKIAMQEFSGDKVIDRLCSAGISFIAYQMGLGHINISRDELSEYTENPEVFAANKCGVSLQTYRGWLEHFSNPSCQAITRDGNVCGKNIAKTNSPLDFFHGESDRCEDHRKNNVVNFRFGK